MKSAVQAFWDDAPCGEVYAVGDSRRAQLEEQASARYALEHYIFEFADFAMAGGRDVLEIGVGMGADHLQWARANPRSLVGIDLSQRAIEVTAERLQFAGLRSHLRVADAESLPYKDESFDIVYSWGVLHHSPDTRRAVTEVRRVLRPGGRAVVMIYHRHSFVGLLLWLRFALLAGRPTLGLREIYDRHLESPGTKAFTIEEACDLFQSFSTIRTDIRLSPGDTIEGAAGQRHPGRLLDLARRFWPRGIIKRFFSRYGLYLIVTATK